MVKNNEFCEADTESSPIEALRRRFINLKKENKQLKQRKREINEEMEQVRANERKQVSDMTTELYNKSKEMQEL